MNLRDFFPRTASEASYEFERLATFNAEFARGLVHTPEYREQMRLEQKRFNARQLHQEAA